MTLIGIAPKHGAEIAPRGVHRSAKNPLHQNRQGELSSRIRFEDSPIVQLGRGEVRAICVALDRLDPHRACTRRESPDPLVATMSEP